MADMQFNSDQQNEFSEYARPQSQGFDLTGKLIQWGIVADRKQGEYILIGVLVIVLVLAFFIYRWGAGSSLPVPDAEGNLYYQ